MFFFEICSRSPYSLFRGKDLNGVGVDPSSALDETTSGRAFRVVEPDGLPIFLFDVEMQGGLEDGLCRRRAALGLALFRFLQPLLSRHDDVVFRQALDGQGDQLVDSLLASILFSQTPSSDPDLVTRRNHLVSPVQDFLCVFRGFQSGQRQPQFDRLWDDLDRSAEQDPGIIGIVLEVDDFLPELDRVGNIFEGCNDMSRELVGS